jgi:hypothetical protein
MIEPVLWKRDQLEADRMTAIGLFRKERMEK